MTCKLGFYCFYLSRRCFIYLVNCYNHRNAGCFSCIIASSVCGIIPTICSHHENCNIGYFYTTYTY